LHNLKVRKTKYFYLCWKHCGSTETVISKMYTERFDQIQVTCDHTEQSTINSLTNNLLSAKKLTY
jgi:hypothetical protein